MTKLELAKLIAKYERKLNKEYQRGFDDGVREEARVKRTTTYICPNCKTEMVIKRTLKQ